MMDVSKVLCGVRLCDAVRAEGSAYCGEHSGSVLCAHGGCTRELARWTRRTMCIFHERRMAEVAYLATTPLPVPPRQRTHSIPRSACGLFSI